MPKIKLKKKHITLIHDDREKKPWSNEYLGGGFKTEIRRLKVGDYTIKGMEKLVCIERKANWEEIANNIGAAKNRNNFEKELIAMGKFPIRMLIINASYAQIPSMVRHSQYVTPTVITDWMIKIELEYGISVIPIGSRALPAGGEFIGKIFKRINDHNAKNRKFHYHKIY